MKIILDDWEACIVDNTNKRVQKGMLPSVYIDILKEWIPSYKEEAHRKYNFDVDKYVQYCDTSGVCRGSHVERLKNEDLDRQPDREFRLTVGIQGGVIFDELSGNTNYWAGRKDEETLGYVGGRIDFAVIALLGSAGSVSTDWGFGGGLRQDLGGGFYLSDSVDYNPQFIGATILYARCEIQYQARVIFGLDAGIGMAYGNGSKDDPHQPLYFFDWEVEHSSVALAGLLGLSLDFFGGSSSKVGWGIGLYTLFATSSGDNTRHGAIILEPDLHIIFAF